MPFLRGFLRCVAVAGAFVAIHAAAAPVINIGSMFDYLGSDRSTILKQIRNTGDSTAFVKVSVSEIVYGESGETEERPLDTQGLSAGGGVGLIASPMRLIVPAGGMQATRLLFRGERDVERHYRVRFIPVLPDAGDEFALAEGERQKYQEGLRAGVSVLTGYGAITIVRPAESRFDTRIEQTAERFSVRNFGNSTIVLDGLMQCDAAQKECAAPMVRHVRPGGDIEFDKQAGPVVTFNLVEGNKQSAITIK